MKLKQKYEKWMETGKLPNVGLCNSRLVSSHCYECAEDAERSQDY